MISRPLLAAVFAVSLSLPAVGQEYVAGVEREGSYDIQEGTDLVMAYFGGSTCFACNQPDFKMAIERAKSMLAEQAASDGKTFVALGVALDPGVADGLGFLQSSGQFDEIAVGRNWFNSAALSHIWRPEGLEDRIIAEPTVIVFERDMRMGEAISVEDFRYLVERVGSDRITEWVEAGVPLE